jgi:hypothetical protein
MIAMAAIVPASGCWTWRAAPATWVFECRMRCARHGLDVTARMIDLARRSRGAPPATWIVGDMGACRRGIVVRRRDEGVWSAQRSRPAAAIAENLARAGAGGRFYSLDFNRPQSAPVRADVPRVPHAGRERHRLLLHRDPDTLSLHSRVDSRYPGAAGVVTQLTSADFARRAPCLCLAAS